MVNNVYVIYNKLSKRYGDVVSFSTDAFAVKRIKESFSQNPESIEEIELCRVGTVDIETGNIISHAPVRIELADKKDINQIIEK